MGIGIRHQGFFPFFSPNACFCRQKREVFIGLRNISLSSSMLCGHFDIHMLGSDLPPLHLRQMVLWMCMLF